jgi:hypothetical protein
MTREQWLNAFIKKSTKHFKNLDAPLPSVRASIGFTSKGQRAKAIGECWSDSCSKDGVHEIFIVPGQDDAERVADILTHELVHAAVGIPAGHGPAFRRVATGLGLEGKMTATVAGDAWREWALPIIDKIGPFPHAALEGRSSLKPKQGTRMLKCTCGSCGFTFRASSKWAYSSDLQCPDPGCGSDVAVE